MVGWLFAELVCGIRCVESLFNLTSLQFRIGLSGQALGKVKSIPCSCQHPTLPRSYLSAMWCEYWGVMKFPRCVYVSLKLKMTALWGDVILSHVCCVTDQFKL